MIAPRAIVCLGLTQLIGWGVTFYLIGALGPAMTADLGWNAATVYGGFSAAIVTMALVSPLAGAAVDRWGGHRVMPVGAVIAAAGCALLAAAHHVPVYFLAWLLLGLGMRLCLYDAAFACLADNPMLQDSLRERFAYIDPLNYLQIDLIRRHRAAQKHPDAEVDKRVQSAIHLTINGIAAGLRNSG